MLSLAWFPADELVSVPAGIKDAVGYELDFGYSYQYTEDVSFGLCVDYAVAGKAVKQAVGGAPFFDDAALEVIGTVAVAF